MTGIRAVVIMVGAAAVLALVAPAAADATAWGTLTVYDDGTVRGQASGRTTISGGVSAKVTASYNGSAARPTRVENYSNWWQPSTTNHEVYLWSPGPRKDTPSRSSSTRTTVDLYFPLRTGADRVRVNTKICVPKPWGTPVPCSPFAIVTHSY